MHLPRPLKTDPIAKTSIYPKFRRRPCMAHSLMAGQGEASQEKTASKQQTATYELDVAGRDEFSNDKASESPRDQTEGIKWWDRQLVAVEMREQGPFVPRNLCSSRAQR